MCAILLRHGRQVARKAVEIAGRVPGLEPDIEFIEEAAMLHDIGICMTNTPSLGCTGIFPYVCHGVLGREILDRKGMHRHALVCERHVGVGIGIRDIKEQNLPLPERDMFPETIEEKIICYSDKFFSKGAEIKREKSVEEIVGSLAPYGEDKVRKLHEWIELFEQKNRKD